MCCLVCLVGILVFVVVRCSLFVVRCALSVVCWCCLLRVGRCLFAFVAAVGCWRCVMSCVDAVA